MGGMLFLKFVGRSIYGTRLKTYLGDIRHTNRKLSRYACTYIVVGDFYMIHTFTFTHITLSSLFYVTRRIL